MRFILPFILLIVFSCKEKVKKITTKKKPDLWEQLVDKDLSKWDIFMGIPHKSSGISGYENVEDVRFGTPIGLNKDPKGVFSVVEENGDQVIKITGEVFAGLVTKKSYKNYHLKTEFKWGDKKWEPRLNQKRNSGILYHSIGNYDDFWNVWMTSLEFEVQETDCADFITISETSVRAKCPATKKEDGKYYFDENAPLVDFAWRKNDIFETGRCWKNNIPEDPEFPHGEWNTLELICYKNTAIHIVNGVVAMTVHEPQFLDSTNTWVPMTEGKIQLQSEAAEIYYKNIQIKTIEDMDEKYTKYVRESK